MDFVLNGDYIWYGIKWLQWSQLDNSAAYDYMGARETPKPGNVLLPPFGYCEMIESAKDIKISLSNKHKFVCELSQHVLYQYCLFVLWLATVVGIVVTVFGVLQCLFNYLFLAVGVRKFRRRYLSDPVLLMLKVREIEYLEKIRRHDVVLYEKVISKIVKYCFNNDK